MNKWTYDDVYMCMYIHVSYIYTHTYIRTYLMYIRTYLMYICIYLMHIYMIERLLGSIQFMLFVFSI